VKIKLRSLQDADKALVYDSWLRHLATTAGLRFDDVAPNARRLIDRVLTRPTTSVRVAVDADDRDKILGLAVLDEDLALLHWVWVRSEARGWGICRAMLRNLPAEMNAWWMSRNTGAIARCVGKLTYAPMALLEV
jgi:hypothetical protein